LHYLNRVVKPSGQTATDTKTRILDPADEIFVRRGIDAPACRTLPIRQA